MLLTPRGHLGGLPNGVDRGPELPSAKNSFIDTTGGGALTSRPRNPPTPFCTVDDVPRVTSRVTPGQSIPTYTKGANRYLPP